VLSLMQPVTLWNDYSLKNKWRSRILPSTRNSKYPTCDWRHNVVPLSIFIGSPNIKCTTRVVGRYRPNLMPLHLQPLPSMCLVNPVGVLGVKYKMNRSHLDLTHRSDRPRRPLDIGKGALWLICLMGKTRIWPFHHLCRNIWICSFSCQWRRTDPLLELKQAAN